MGYGGSGPAQLALALLADCIGDERAQKLYQDFKFEIVVALPSALWMLTEDYVKEVAARLEEKEGTGDE